MRPDNAAPMSRGRIGNEPPKWCYARSLMIS